MIKCVIIEDEDNSRDLLINMIKRYCQELEIIGVASGVEEAIALVNEKQPDLLFMDVEINGGTGFDVLNGIESNRPGVIFTTGYNHYAIRAIKFSAIDYLLKPIDLEELIDSINKFKEIANLLVDERHLAFKQIVKNSNFQSIIIPTLKGFTLHTVSDIIRLSSEGNYTTFKFINNEMILTSKPIGFFEEFLPESLFYRIHNRTIINIKMIKEYIKGRGGIIIMRDGEQLEVAERRRDGLLNLLQK